MTELEILLKLRKKYLLSLFFPFLKKTLHTSAGMCYCLFYIAYESSYEAVCILRKQFIKEYGYDPIMYWFKEGRIRPRLRLINKTIKQLKREKITAVYSPHSIML